jgi:addiction module HigA family antidote
MSKDMARPRHPGEILRDDFMGPAGLSATALAKALGVNPPRINDILLKRRGITGDTALRLARYFGGEALDWLHWQARYVLSVAEGAAGKAIEREIVPRVAANKKASGRSDR